MTETENHPTNAPERLELSIGRDTIKSNLTLEASVVGGGAVKPSVIVHSDYDTRQNVRHIADYRSGTGRSGSLLFKLEEDRFYEIYSAKNSSKGWISLISTFDGVTVELGQEDFEAALQRHFPVGYELAKVRAEQRRIAEEAHQQAELVRERERLERMRADAERREAEITARKARLAEEAKKIETEGQPESDLPKLSGSPKQIAWAIKIRDAVARNDPKHASLKKAKTAKFWIDNHRSELRAD